MTPARGPSVAPTKPYTLPAWLKRWVSRTKVQAMSKTPMVASANARGTARPMVLAVPCGVMVAAIDGAIRAREMPTASPRCSSRRKRGLSVLPVFLTSVDMVPPLLGGIQRIDLAEHLSLPRYGPNISRHDPTFHSARAFRRDHGQDNVNFR